MFYVKMLKNIPIGSKIHGQNLKMAHFILNLMKKIFTFDRMANFKLHSYMEPKKTALHIRYLFSVRNDVVSLLNQNSAVQQCETL